MNLSREPMSGSHVERASRAKDVAGLLLYAAFIAYQSLAAGGTWACSGPVLAVPMRISRTDVLANVLAYVPLGLLLMRTLRPASARWVALAASSLLAALACAGLSLAMELVQACQAARVSSVLDWGANVTGGLLGILLALAISLTAGVTGRRADIRGASPGRLRLLTIGIAGGWILSQTAPWVFAVDVGTPRSNLAFLRHWPDALPLDGWSTLRHAGAWVAVGCACRLAASGAAGGILGFVGSAGLSLGLQLLLDARSPLSFEELAGMAGAMCVLLAMAFAGERTRRGRWAIAMVAGALSAIAAYQLRPVPGASGTLAFSWLPQVGLAGLRGAIDYALLFGWFGLTVATGARWARGDGYGHARWWPALAVAATLAFEAAQTVVPGRGPDVSAPLFTVLALFVTSALLAADAAPVRNPPDTPAGLDGP